MSESMSNAERVGAKSSVQLAREACSTEQGKLALYYLAGRLSDLPSFCLIAPDDNGISRKQVLDLIRDLQRGAR